MTYQDNACPHCGKKLYSDKEQIVLDMVRSGSIVHGAQLPTIMTECPHCGKNLLSVPWWRRKYIPRREYIPKQSKITWSILAMYLGAFLLTAILGVYQRMTGPTYPVRGREIFAGKTVSYGFLRSYTAGVPLPVTLQIPATRFSGKIYFRRFKTGEDWATVDLVPSMEGGRLQACIPGQPAAGKIEYRVELSDGAQERMLLSGRSIVARFKNRVPGWLLIIHVILMFSGMLFAFRTGMEALRPQGRHAGLVTLTLILISFGGLIMGPVIQKIAFGSFWTGFPLGGDLTDTKTLVIVLFWLIAFFMRRKNRWWALAALLLMIAIYLVPHSLLGSELDYRTGRIISG